MLHLRQHNPQRKKMGTGVIPVPRGDALAFEQKGERGEERGGKGPVDTFGENTP